MLVISKFGCMMHLILCILWNLVPAASPLFLNKNNNNDNMYNKRIYPSFCTVSLDRRCCESALPALYRLKVLCIFLFNHTINEMIYNTDVYNCNLECFKVYIGQDLAFLFDEVTGK